MGRLSDREKKMLLRAVPYAFKRNIISVVLASVSSFLLASVVDGGSSLAWLGLTCLFGTFVMIFVTMLLEDTITKLEYDTTEAIDRIIHLEFTPLSLLFLAGWVIDGIYLYIFRYDITSLTCQTAISQYIGCLAMLVLMPAFCHRRKLDDRDIIVFTSQFVDGITIPTMLYGMVGMIVFMLIGFAIEYADFMMCFGGLLCTLLALIGIIPNDKEGGDKGIQTWDDRDAFDPTLSKRERISVFTACYTFILPILPAIFEMLYITRDYSGLCYAIVFISLIAIIAAIITSEMLLLNIFVTIGFVLQVCLFFYNSVGILNGRDLDIFSNLLPFNIVSIVMIALSWYYDYQKYRLPFAMTAMALAATSSI